jgi:hypothetical protein
MRYQPLPANRSPLQPAAFVSLPLGAIHPRGWLLDQLRVQAAGLTGHLDEFWPDVGLNNGWLGGNGESWERGPYYLDGLLPLDTSRRSSLIAKANRWITPVLTAKSQTVSLVQPTATVAAHGHAQSIDRLLRRLRMSGY